VHIAALFEFNDALILTWNTLNWNMAMMSQWDINTAMTDKDQVSSKWLKMLLHESCTTEMKVLEYGNLPVCFHRGATYAWILCHKLFGLNCDTVTALIYSSSCSMKKGYVTTKVKTWH
jgi:hypothetical protein